MQLIIFIFIGNATIIELFSWVIEWNAHIEICQKDAITLSVL